jgi:excisionase family DNA binding protein
MTTTPSNHPTRREPTGLLTLAQVAARLGIHVLTVRRWVRTVQCPTVRDGRRVRIPSSWVDELIQKGWN